jgi:pimeloyl-ACP methyl ester carboxylesterase
MRVYKTEAGERALRASYDRLVGMWGVETEQRYVEGSYGKTHAILAGDPSKPTLLMFHGVGDDSAIMWVKNAKELSKSFRLVAIDTMGGSGKSLPDERYGKGFDLPTWYGDVLDGLGLEESYAVGVSYGAYHCQLIAHSYPERIKKFVGVAGYVSATGYGGSRYAAILRAMIHAVPVAIMPTRKNILRAGGKMMGMPRAFLESEPALADHFVLGIKHYRAQAQFNHNRRTFSPEEIEAFRGKCLFLIGEEDGIVNFPGAKRAMRDFRINQKTYPGAGHALNFSRQKEVESEIVRFCLG